MCKLEIIIRNNKVDKLKRFLLFKYIVLVVVDLIVVKVIVLDILDDVE